MPRILGNKNEGARIIVFDENDWSIESNTLETGSGAYEIEGLNENDKTVIARNDVGEVEGYGAITPFADDIEEEFGVAYREVRPSGAWNSKKPDVTFDKRTDNGTYIMMSNSIARDCWMHYFAVFNKNTLNGRKLRIDWSASTGNGAQTKLLIADGKYDRTSFADFPHESGVPYTSKGNGDLFTFVDTTNSFSRYTYTTGVLNMSTASLDQVTLFIYGRSPYLKSLQINVWDLKLLSSSNVLVSDFDLAGSSFVKELQLTDHDYGRCGTPIDL